MSRYMGNKAAAAPRKGGSPLWAGIFIGMVAGAGLAAGVAWYMMKSPGPFLPKEQIDVVKPLPPAETTAPAAPSLAAPSGSGNGKPRFEFYNVLTDKQGAKSTTPAKPVERVKQPENAKSADSKPVAAYEPQILQVGSFASAEDAEKLKARLALIGAEAHIQTASVPDKGVRYRVRLGPYKSEDEMSRARNFLKQNEVDSTPMRAQ